MTFTLERDITRCHTIPRCLHVTITPLRKWESIHVRVIVSLTKPLHHGRVLQERLMIKANLLAREHTTDKGILTWVFRIPGYTSDQGKKRCGGDRFFIGRNIFWNLGILGSLRQNGARCSMKLYNKTHLESNYVYNKSQPQVGTMLSNKSRQLLEKKAQKYQESCARIPAARGGPNWKSNGQTS